MLGKGTTRVSSLKIFNDHIMYPRVKFVIAILCVTTLSFFAAVKAEDATTLYRKRKEARVERLASSNWPTKPKLAAPTLPRTRAHRKRGEKRVPWPPKRKSKKGKFQYPRDPIHWCSCRNGNTTVSDCCKCRTDVCKCWDPWWTWPQYKHHPCVSVCKRRC